MSVEKSAEEEEEGTVLVSRPEDIHDIIKEKGVRGGVRGGGGIIDIICAYYTFVHKTVLWLYSRSASYSRCIT